MKVLWHRPQRLSCQSSAKTSIMIFWQIRGCCCHHRGQPKPQPQPHLVSNLICSRYLQPRYAERGLTSKSNLIDGSMITSICVWACVHVRARMCVQVRVCVRVCECECVCASVCECERVHVRVCVWVRVWVRVCACVRLKNNVRYLKMQHWLKDSHFSVKHDFSLKPMRHQLR